MTIGRRPTARARLLAAPGDARQEGPGRLRRVEPRRRRASADGDEGRRRLRHRPAHGLAAPGRNAARRARHRPRRLRPRCARGAARSAVRALRQQGRRVLRPRRGRGGQGASGKSRTGRGPRYPKAVAEFLYRKRARTTAPAFAASSSSSRRRFIPTPAAPTNGSARRCTNWKTCRRCPLLDAGLARARLHERARARPLRWRKARTTRR